MRPLAHLMLLLTCSLPFMVRSSDVPARESPPGAGKPPAIIYTYDARPLNALDLRNPTNAMDHWDTMHCLAALQGLVNRGRPEFYLFYCSEFGVDTDQFWFDWLNREDRWLKSSRFVALQNVGDVIQHFKKRLSGLVVYDPAVPATANVASTAAGCENLLPVRYDRRPDSLYIRITQAGDFPVKLWLLNPDGTSKFTGKGQIPDFDERTTGSAKTDAYRWALRRYLDTRRCNPGIGAYYLDSFWIGHPTRGGPTMHTLSNHDYYIARRAFFFDVSPWGDETPNDDPTQPLGADKMIFMEVLRSLYRMSEQVNGANPILAIGGFPPWPYKYTSHAKPPNKYDGVPTEWEFGRLISQFNGYMEADAAGLGAIANASFFQHYPLAAKYPQPNPIPTHKEWKMRSFIDEKGRVAAKFYVGHYVGDYDAPSWLYKAVPAFFRDQKRGQVPLGWAFNPNLADRAPQAMVYARSHASTNDFFIAGDSGAGYLNPRSLTIRNETKLPSGLDAWKNHCRKYYNRWDLSITGFILDGSGGRSTSLEYAAYGTFSPHGAGTHFEPGPALFGTLATCPERDLPDDSKAAVAVIVDAARKAHGKPGFLWARSILKSPSWYADISKNLEQDHPELQIEVVDPYTFFGLIREHLRH